MYQVLRQDLRFSHLSWRDVLASIRSLLGQGFKGYQFEVESGFYLGVKPVNFFFFSVAIVKSRVYDVDFFVFFVLRHSECR